jgi:hypothetical protein
MARTRQYDVKKQLQQSYDADFNGIQADFTALTARVFTLEKSAGIGIRNTATPPGSTVAGQYAPRIHTHKLADITGGVSGTVPLAPLTVGGTRGSLTFINGILTARVAPT